MHMFFFFYQLLYWYLNVNIPLSTAKYIFVDDDEVDLTCRLLGRKVHVKDTFDQHIYDKYVHLYER